MQDNDLWPNAETLLDVLSSLFCAEDKTVYVQDSESLLQEYSFLSEVFEWVYNEWITRSEARQGPLLDCQTVQVKAFGEVYFGDPLRVLVELGRDVQGKFFWSFIRHIERGGELLAPNAMEYHWLEERPTSLTLQQFIFEKCSFWSKQSQEFRRSADYKPLLHFLECQCIAIHRDVLKSIGTTSTNPAATETAPEPDQTIVGLIANTRSYKKYELDLYEKVRLTKNQFTIEGKRSKDADVFRHLSKNMKLEGFLQGSDEARKAIGDIYYKIKKCIRDGCRPIADNEPSTALEAKSEAS